MHQLPLSDTVQPGGHVVWSVSRGLCHVLDSPATFCGTSLTCSYSVLTFPVSDRLLQTSSLLSSPTPLFSCAFTFPPLRCFSLCKVNQLFLCPPSFTAMTSPFDSLRRNSKKLKHRFSKKHGNHYQIATVTDDSLQSQPAFTSLPPSHSVPNLTSFLKRTSAKNKSTVSFDLSTDTTPEFHRSSSSRRHSVDQVGTVIDIRKKRGISLSPPPRPVTVQVPTIVHDSYPQQHSFSLHKEKFDGSTINLPSNYPQKRVLSDSSLLSSSDRSRTRPRSLIFDDLQYKPEHKTSFYKLPAFQAKSTSSLLTMTKHNESFPFIASRSPRIIINNKNDTKVKNINNHPYNNNNSVLTHDKVHVLDTPPLPVDTIPDIMLSMGFYLFNFIFSIFFYLPIFIVTKFSHLSILIASFAFVIWYTNGWLWTMIPSDSTI